mmetsp:Transcript_112529/g.223656  ORF Transcript_112529/g.223656 Transcript_112529/m.223656 type:complete len:1232 (-) Transcript_112529:86-3781(-)
MADGPLPAAADATPAAVAPPGDEAVTLSITITSAKGLRDADWVPGSGTSDPYCVCEVFGRGVSTRTKVVNNNLDPVWDHHAELAGFKPGDALVFSVFDDDLGRKTDFLGHVTVPSDKFYPGGFSGELALEEKEKVSSGSIQVKIEAGGQPGENTSETAGYPPPAAKGASKGKAPPPTKGKGTAPPAGAKGAPNPPEGKGVPPPGPAGSKGAPPPKPAGGKGVPPPTKAKTAGPPGPPKAKTGSKPKGKSLTVKAKTKGGGTGMAALLNRVQAEGKRKDAEEALGLDDVDLSQIDPSARQKRVKCVRCEQEVIEDQLDSHMSSHSSEILPCLFLGGNRNAENAKELTVRTGITHILNLAHECNLWVKEVEIPVREYNEKLGLGFYYKKYPFGDTPEQDMLPDLPDAIDFIHQARQSDARHKVLVHCVQGISRSATVVVAYLMKYEKMSLLDAHEHTRKRRPVASPRKEFVDQLGRFECQIHGVSVPTLTGEQAYAGKLMLNLDMSLRPEDVAAAKEADWMSQRGKGKAPAPVCPTCPEKEAPAPKGKGKGPPLPKTADVSIAENASAVGSTDAPVAPKGKGKGKAPPVPKSPLPKAFAKPVTNPFLPKKPTLHIAPRLISCQSADGHFEAEELGKKIKGMYDYDGIATSEDFAARLQEAGDAFPTIFVLGLYEKLFLLGEESSVQLLLLAEGSSPLAGERGPNADDVPALTPEQRAQKKEEIVAAIMQQADSVCGEAWRECALEWLNGREVPQELHSKADALLHSWFNITQQRKVVGVSKEEQEKKRIEQRRKSEILRHEEAKRARHWQSMRPRSIDTVPWNTVKTTMWCQGGSGGALLVQLGDTEAVVVKPLGLTAVYEAIAVEVANLLGVRVANSRVITMANEEFSEMSSALHNAPVMLEGDRHKIGAVLTSGTRQCVAILEFVPGTVLQGQAGLEALKRPTAHQLFEDLGELIALDALLNNMDRVPAIWQNDGNLANIIVSDNTIVGIDQQVNPISDEKGREAYMARVREFCRDAGNISLSSAAVTNIRAAMLQNCGFESNDVSCHRLMTGVRTVFRRIADVREQLLAALPEIKKKMTAMFSNIPGALDRLDLAFAHLTDCTKVIAEICGTPPAARRSSIARSSLARSSVSRGSLPRRGSNLENFPAGVVVHRMESTGSLCSAAPDEGQDALQLCRDIKDMVGELRSCLQELCAAAGSEPVDAGSMAALGSALTGLAISAGRVVESSAN